MAKNKTTYTRKDVSEFINEFVTSKQKQDDSYELMRLMRNITGFEPRMWGPTIIGFGNYHYRYKSGHEGDAPIIGFSPRKAAISLYVFTGLPEHEHLLDNIGNIKRGKSCLYVNKLSDIDTTRLERLIKETVAYMSKKYPG